MRRRTGTRLRRISAFACEPHVTVHFPHVKKNRSHAKNFPVLMRRRKLLPIFKKKLKKILKKGPTAIFLFKKNTPGCILKKLESLLDCLLLVGWLVGWLVGDGACLRCCCCYFCCCHFAVVILLLLFCCC